MYNEIYDNAVKLQTKRIFSVLAKKMLMTLEDLQFEHNRNFDKLHTALPQFVDLLHQADYFDKEAFAHYRKRFLDATGDAFRELEEELKKYELELRR